MYSLSQKLTFECRNIQVWKFTVNTEAESAGEKTTGIPINLYNQTGVRLIVHWGDGTSNILTSTDYTETDSTASVHTYSQSGIYQVVISGESQDWENAYLHSNGIGYDDDYTGLHDSIRDLYWFKRTLIHVDSKIPKIRGIYEGDDETAVLTTRNNFNYFFYLCNHLASIPKDLFSQNTTATSFDNCFASCSSLEAIPEELFSNNLLATSFSSCFSSCSSLEVIPEELFSNNTMATAFDYCFINCSSIASIPAGLFTENTLATNFNSCFYGCSSIASIPARLFTENTAATSFSGCFYGCSSIASIPAGLFTENTAATNFRDCFRGCSSLQSIPSRLFSTNTAVTTYHSCFMNCSLLLNFNLIISSSLVSSFYNFVPNASNVTRTICVPANSTTYTTLSSYANSSNNIIISTDITDCSSSLSNILEYTINTEATTANEKTATVPLTAVNNASSKLTIDWDDGNAVELLPSDLTTANLTHIYTTPGIYQITVTTNSWSDYEFISDTSSSNTLKNTFNKILISVDSPFPGLANTTIASWFNGCTKLTSIPSGLFDNLNGITSAYDCFDGCLALTSIPSGLFDNLNGITDFSQCFASCGITSIPNNLFNYNTAATNFSYCFALCPSLTSFPSNLFVNNTAVTTFEGCFMSLSAWGVPAIFTDFTLHIGSSIVSNAANFVELTSGTTRTVYVPNGSTTHTTFNAIAADTGLTIIGE